MDTIEKHSHGFKNSFLYELEKGSFSIDLLMELVLAVALRVKEAQDRELSNEKILDLSSDLLTIYDRANSYIWDHFNPRDSYTITNLPVKFKDYLRRLSFVMQMFLEKDYDTIVECNEDDMGSWLPSSFPKALYDTDPELQIQINMADKKFCCAKMAANLEHVCDQHKNVFDCPDSLIHYDDRFDEYGIIIHDGGCSCSTIYFCPWCGYKLPESQRDEWFKKYDAKRGK